MSPDLEKLCLNCVYVKHVKTIFKFQLFKKLKFLFGYVQQKTVY